MNIKRSFKYLLMLLATCIACLTFAACSGEPGANGADGLDGVDGVGIHSAVLNQGDLILTLTDGTLINVGSVVGADGQDGKDGQDGVDGADGQNGIDGKDGTGVASIIINAEGKLIITLTDKTEVDLGVVVGSDGADGTDGRDGKDGQDGADGADGQNGINGKDGTGIASILINEEGKLIITLTDETEIDLGVVVGSDGADGKDGQDGADGSDAVHAGETHTVTFSVEGGVMPEGAQTSLTVSYGDVLNLPIPTKENYTFEGWFTGNTVNDGKFTSVTPVTKDITLIAHWKANISYRLMYETNGGNGIAPTLHYFDEELFMLPEPVKYDCAFVGWYLDEELTLPLGYPLTLTQNTVIFAKWTTAYYYINFHTNSNEIMQPMYAQAGTSYEAFSAPENKNYEFLGWYYDSGYTQPVSFPLELHSNIDVYAKWDYKYYSVSFNSNGGSYVSSQNYQSGYFVSEFPTPTKTNYRFLGWYLNGELTQKVSYPCEITSNLTLYASWQYVDPYADYVRITDAVQLQNISDMNGKYVLMNDIDCEGLEISIIGSLTSPFTGIFIGNDHTLSNFSIYVQSGDYVGLFAVNNGTIRNLKIENMSILYTEHRVKTKYVGGVVGLNNGTITAVEAKVNIQSTIDAANVLGGASSTGYIYAGGIAGSNTGNINNCVVDGFVSSYVGNLDSNTLHYTGGITGLNSGAVSKCLVSAAISSTNYETSRTRVAGGIVGVNEGVLEYSLLLGSVSGTNYGSINAICATNTEAGVMTSCYKANSIVVSGGTAATVSYLNSSSFYTNTLGWDADIWDLSTLNFDEGLYAKLK